MIEGNIPNQQARDGGHVANYLLENAGGYRFDLGRDIEYRGRRRRFSLGIHRGPWSFYLTLLPDVHADLLDHFERTRGHRPKRDELVLIFKERRLDDMPPLIAIANAKGQEPRAPRGVRIEPAEEYWFLPADRAGWPWRAHQSLKLLKRILDEIQGKVRK